MIKRRTVANEACDSEKVWVNGKPARASYEVKPGDRIELHFGQRLIQVEVVRVSEHAAKNDAPAMYREIAE